MLLPNIQTNLKTIMKFFFASGSSVNEISPYNESLRFLWKLCSLLYENLIGFHPKCCFFGWQLLVKAAGQIQNFYANPQRPRVQSFQRFMRWFIMFPRKTRTDPSSPLESARVTQFRGVRLTQYFDYPFGDIPGKWIVEGCSRTITEIFRFRRGKKLKNEIIGQSVYLMETI